MALLNNRWQKDEKVVLERHSQSILPILLLTVGVIGVVLGLVIAIETETAAFLLGVPFLILGAVLYSGTKMHLTVTTKRVIMDGPFSRYTVLPLQGITAMTAQNNVLHISSAGGHIQMGGVDDARGVCDRVFALLNEENVNDIPDEEVPNRKTWVCVCGMPNDESSRVCRGCGNPRPNGAAPRAAAPKGVGYTKCTTCGVMVPDNACCPVCGERVVASRYQQCPSCGATVPTGDACPLCGKTFL